MNILLAPNSFKESADSTTISKILAEELKENHSVKIIEKPLSDGGDGFLSVCQKIFNCDLLTYNIPSIYSQVLNPITIGYSKIDKTIFIESAEAIGLKKVPESFRNPLKLNTFPLGFLLKTLSEDVKNNTIGVKEVVIGVGGTATVDFGLGVAAALGLKIYDEYDKQIEIIPANYNKIKRLTLPTISLPFHLKVIADITTLLFNKDNAIELYSRQKGASDSDIKFLVEGFVNIVNLLKSNNLISLPNELIGAGGGLSAGLKIFFNSQIITSREFIFNTILKDVDIKSIDFVITGEGAFDKQSFENKGAYLILEKFKDYNIPVFLICGIFDYTLLNKLPKNVIIIELKKFFRDKEESMKNFKIGLQKAAKEVISHLKN